MNTRRKENNLVGNLKEALSMVSDDMDYLREAWKMLRNKPCSVPQEHVDASFCRLFLLVVIAGIELLGRDLKTDRQSNAAKALRGDSSNNEESVHALLDVAKEIKFTIDPDVIEDYFCLRSLRHSIVHGLKENTTELFAKRKWPSNPNGLRKEHWQRIERVNEMMMGFAYVLGNESGVKS